WGAGDAADGAAGERLQRLRAAAEVVDGDVEALLLEVAEPLCNGQRQIVERGLAADAQSDLLLFGRLSLRGAHESQNGDKRCEEKFCLGHVVLPTPARSLSVRSRESGPPGAVCSDFSAFQTGPPLPRGRTECILLSRSALARARPPGQEPPFRQRYTPVDDDDERRQHHNAGEHARDV